MIAEIQHRGRTFRVDLAKPLDLSLSLHAGEGQVRAWWVGPVRMEPVQNEGITYAVVSGAPVNFRDVHFNPHGHGTHTESVGHIAPEAHPGGCCVCSLARTSRAVMICWRTCPGTRAPCYSCCP